MIRLFTSYFDEEDKQRRYEFDLCLQRNIENPLIDFIHLFCETDQLPDFADVDKIIIHEAQKRPTYGDFFEVMREYIGQITILANSDIYFDETIDKVNDMRLSQCYAITRRELGNNEQILPFSGSHVEWSQDAWIFRKAPENVGRKYFEVLAENVAGTRELIPFNLGVAGCDNHIAYLLKHAYDIVNPYHDIRAIHVHKEEKRNYKIKHRITGAGRSRFGSLHRIKPTRI